MGLLMGILLGGLVVHTGSTILADLITGRYRKA